MISDYDDSIAELEVKFKILLEDFEKVEWLRNELIKGEESGLSNKTMSEILEEAKRRAKLAK
ncbi:hypothetical protein A33Q_2835 [Indibacter alkaliphilus LW1]|uniref:Uncharacterized protein n=1 Tax=Indibacter alkaliphilus (strain CCUG 57479 / KCTC 22604 / LW1) TaxID=1189612 RepID=S2E0A3_INDAL|nr:hypothetical protein A33Q_2835 [Indibacter alkaliphilus LW1]